MPDPPPPTTSESDMPPPTEPVLTVPAATAGPSTVTTGTVANVVARMQTRALTNLQSAQGGDDFGTPSGLPPIPRRKALYGESARRTLMERTVLDSSEDQPGGPPVVNIEEPSTSRQADDEGGSLRDERGGMPPTGRQEVRGGLTAAERFPQADMIAREATEIARRQLAEEREAAAAEQREQREHERQVMSVSMLSDHLNVRMAEAANARIVAQSQAGLMAAVQAAIAPAIMRLETRLDRLEVESASRDSTPRSMNGGIIGGAPTRAISYTSEEGPRSSSPLEHEGAHNMALNVLPVTSSMIPGSSRPVSPDSGIHEGSRASAARIGIFAAREPADRPFERTQEVERWLRQIEILTMPRTDAARIQMARVTCEGRADLVVNGPTAAQIYTWSEFKDFALNAFRGRVDPALFTSLRGGFKIRVPDESPLDFLDRVRAFVHPMKRAYPECMGGVEITTFQMFMDGLEPYALKKEVQYDDHGDPERVAMKAQRVWRALKDYAALTRTRSPLERPRQKAITQGPSPVVASAAVLTEQFEDYYDEEEILNVMAVGGNQPRAQQPLVVNGIPVKWCTIHKTIFHNTDECKDPNPLCYVCRVYGHTWRGCPEVSTEYLLFLEGGGSPSATPQPAASPSGPAKASSSRGRGSNQSRPPSNSARPGGAPRSTAAAPPAAEH